MSFDQEKPLSAEDRAYLLDDEQIKSSPKSLKTKRHTQFFIIGLLICLLFASNLALFLSLTKEEKGRHENSFGTASLTSRHTHDDLSFPEIEIPGDLRQFQHEDPLYVSPNKEIADAAWDNYSINGFVALPNSWAVNRGWKTGLQMPGDPKKSIFVIDAFHQIHCLVSLRFSKRGLQALLTEHRC